MLYLYLHSRFMGEKGEVRKMSTRSTGGARKMTPHEKKWIKSQDHFNCFTNLIKIELDDELNMVNERWKTWSKQSEWHRNASRRTRFDETRSANLAQVLMQYLSKLSLRLCQLSIVFQPWDEKAAATYQPKENMLKLRKSTHD